MAAIKPANSSIKSLGNAISHYRCLHTTTPRHGSPFFALAALSNSRETNHLSKLSKLSRVQHSPSLQLIESSEVFPFASPIPPETLLPATVPPPVEEIVSQTSEISEAELMSLGRAILAEKNAEIAKLRGELENEKDRSMKREASYTLARQKSRERIQRLSEDVSSARTWKWIFLVLGGSVAVWAYSQDGVKQAWRSTVVTEPPRVKIEPVKSRPVTTSTTLPSTIPAFNPASVPIAKPIAQEKSSWPSVFWAK